MRPAVFLDRDDTLIANRAITEGTRHPGDLYDPDLVTLLPGAAGACWRLAVAGYALVVVSNQGGVARGHCTIEQVEATNERMRGELRAHGVELTGIYYCPYHPKGTVEPFHVEHPWRKPAPGMLLAARDDLELDLDSSWMVGDSARDIEAAIAAGIDPGRAILIGLDASARCEDLEAAARLILRAEGYE